MCLLRIVSRKGVDTLAYGSMIIADAILGQHDVLVSTTSRTIDSRAMLVDKLITMILLLVVADSS